MKKPLIIIGSYMFRYPLGGMLSWVLQYLTGFQKLGCDVYFVEKFGYPNSCYDPIREIMSDDCSYGLKLVSKLIDDHGLTGRWCFMDRWEEYYGMDRDTVNDLFKNADLFIDMGTHGAWMDETENTGKTLLLDGEPGFTQIKMANKIDEGEYLPSYDLYYTVGCNIGSPGNKVPTLGLKWNHIWHPVDMSLFSNSMTPEKPRFSTIMNWKSHDHIKHKDRIFGQKDLEFAKIVHLPKKVMPDMEIAISGKQLPVVWFKENGWQLKSGKDVTISFESFRDYIARSSAEFSICKHVFVENQTGWFSDKSAAYLASSRPVVLQDTGFSKCLPCGEGLFSFRTLDEAETAIDEVCSSYQKHSGHALEIAHEYLSTEKVLKKLLNEIGIY
jgi:hypothetical protein